MPDTSPPISATPEAQRRSADSSMGLLVDIVRASVEPEYALVAERRGDPPPPGGGGSTPGSVRARRRPPARQVRRRPSYQTGIVLVGVVGTGLLLALALTRTQAEEPSIARARSELVAEVRTATAEVEQLTSDVARLRADVAAARADALQDTSTGRLAAQRLAELEAAAGSTEVRGPGLVVTLDDAPPLEDGSVDVSGRVIDRDVQRAVNALWASGAEAVSVDGIRLTALSSIRAAGDAILVDNRPVVAPYEIVAVGDPATMEPLFQQTDAAEQLRTYSSAWGLGFTVQPGDALVVPPAAGLELYEADVAEEDT